MCVVFVLFLCRFIGCLEILKFLLWVGKTRHQEGGLSMRIFSSLRKHNNQTNKPKEVNYANV